MLARIGEGAEGWIAPTNGVTLTPLQQAFVFVRVGTSPAITLKQVDAEKARNDAIEAALNTARDPGDPRQ
jgi:hypothetical protein